ncbi:MAG: hypothetical protein QM778_04860 [Myxococcales bacterium]
MRGVAASSAVLGFAFLTACTPSVTWTRRAASKPRQAGCSFDVIDLGPRPPLREIGVIEIDAFSPRAIPRREADFRELIAKEVCKVGGEAVVPGIDGFGRYVLATVVTYVKDCSFPPVVPGAPAVNQSCSCTLPPNQGRASW